MESPEKKSRRGLALLFGALLAALGGNCTGIAVAQETNPVPKPAEARYRFVAYGDTRTNNDIHAEIVAGIMKTKPDLALQTGDLVGDSGNEALWKKFDKITEKLRAATPYYSARGNHDNMGGKGYEERVLGGMRPDKIGRVLETRPGGNEYFYAFDKGPLRFIALDTEQDKTLKAGGQQYKWLEGELANAKAEHLLPVVLFHEAIFSIGRHGSNIELQVPLHRLFQQYGVKLVFQGHDHNYYHTVRDGITYIVTGGGGAPLYDFDHIKDAIPGDKYEKDYHFCVCDVFDGKVVITVLRHTLQELEPPFTISLP